MVVKQTQFLLNILVITSVLSEQNIVNIIKEFNKNHNLQINVLINFNINLQQSEHYEDITLIENVPKLIITKKSCNITNLYRDFNKQSLTIAWLSKETLSFTLDYMDQLLWSIHFKDILIINQEETEDDLFKISSLSWKKGFISLLIWQNKRLYTYHPYPIIKIVPIDVLQQYEDKSYLRNFQHKVMSAPIFEFPPMCFSYINHKGELLRVGYVYKWIETFFTHHNATFEYKFYDMWAYNVTYKDAFNTVGTMDFAFIPLIMPAMDHYFARSTTFFLSNIVLIVPAPKEIFTGFYVLIPFDGLVWFMVFLTGILYFVFVNMLNYLNYKICNWGQAFQDAFNIIIFLSVSSRLKMRNYIFNFVYIPVNSVYEPDLRYIEDIKRTKLNILEYTADAPLWVQRNISKTFTERIITGSNKELLDNRQILNMSYMYTTFEEYADFLLFRQTYLKRPTAKKLNELLHHRPIFITLPHRSPIIDRFNRYLLYMMESGIFKKILSDTKWHGILSGRLKLFLDEEENKSLTWEYFQYVFLIWLLGLFSGFLSCLCEMYIFKKIN
ncbi:hypothetical protein CVS40_5827 [Lucilia cuprina]|nr:hypothetical protein CVS40_5827 [Lucilia cuprina]